MKLRTQTMLIVVISFLLFALSLFFSLEANLRNEYDELERRSVENNMQRVANLIEINQHAQLSITEGYAVWTETYDFIHAPSEKYLANNWPDNVFTRFQLQSIFFVNLSGEIVASKSVDLDDGRAEPLAPAFADFVQSHAAAWLEEAKEEGKTGLFSIGETPVLLAMQPVFDNEKRLATNGLLITLQPFDANVVAQLSDAARIPLALQLANNQQNESQLEVSVTPLSEEKIKGEYLFRDYYGAPVLTLYSITDRRIHMAGNHSIHYAVLTFLLLAALFSAAVPYTLNRFVLRRLYHLIKDIDDIAANNQSKEAVRVLGHDELAGLSAKINEMLTALFAEKKLRLAAIGKIEELNRDLELRVLQKTNELEQQFFIDQLTGLPNRFCLARDYQGALSPSVAIIQIRNFRSFSEFWGHDIACEAEKKLAELLNSFASSSKVVVYHFAPGEFAFLGINMTADQFTNLAHFTQKMIEGVSLTLQAHAHNFMATIGLSAGKPNGIERALMAIDFARQKKIGIQMYSDALPMRENCRNNLYWMQEVQEALRENRITLFYQPIKDALTNVINKYEVLVRLQTRQGETILPGEFLSIVKQTNLYHQLTEVILHKAFHHFSNRKEHFSLNISASDIADATIRTLISEMLKQTSLAHRVCFELLESDEFSDLALLEAFVAEVKRAGAEIAIDDFGSGYCNFSQIANMSPDYIKIDGALIKQIGHKHSSQTIVQGIVDFTHALGAKAIAEHVHSEQVIEVAKEIGIDLLQGFRIGRPQAKLPEPPDKQPPQEATEYSPAVVKLLPEPNWTNSTH